MSVHVIGRHLALVAAVLLGVGAAGSGSMVTPEDAIRAAVVARVGASAVVAIDRLETAVAPEAGLVARPDAAARLAQPARFVLEVEGSRRGLAVAVVTVHASYPTAARPIARDEAIGPDAVDLTVGELPALRVHDVLDAAEVVSFEARRAIARGEPLTAAVLREPWHVRSGQEVAIVVRMGDVEVTGTGFASGSGRHGDTVRVRPARHAPLLTARIIGPGIVEVDP